MEIPFLKSFPYINYLEIYALYLSLLIMAEVIVPLRTVPHVIPVVGGQLLPLLHLPDGLDSQGCVAEHRVVVFGVHAVRLPAVVDLVPQGCLVVLVLSSIRENIKSRAVRSSLPVNIDLVVTARVG